MNYTLSREIYGLTPWLMDADSLVSMTSILGNIRNGVALEVPEIKLNTPYIYDAKSETRVITRPFSDEWNKGQLDNSEEFEGVAVINLDGPITVSGGQSTVGMEQLSSFMFAVAKDPRIRSFVIPTNSGGGSSGAVQLMTDTINEIKKTIPVYGLIKKGGMAASAAYGILAACTQIYSESEMNMVGSVGTMIQFDGVEANSTDPTNGVKRIRVYATKSTAKNKAYEEALNNDNYSLLVNELLDPVNEQFISSTLSFRPALSGVKFDDGSIHFAKDVIGTFIDGIASFSQVVNMSVQESTKTNIKSNINSNSNQMTEAQLLSEFPAVHASIMSKGVEQGTKAEKDRNGSWMAHVDTDPAAVKAGIESGEQITATQREGFFVMQNAQNKGKALQQGGAPDLKLNQLPVAGANGAGEQLTKEQIEKKAELDSAFGFDL